MERQLRLEKQYDRVAEGSKGKQKRANQPGAEVEGAKARPSKCSRRDVCAPSPVPSPLPTSSGALALGACVPEEDVDSEWEESDDIAASETAENYAASQQTFNVWTSSAASDSKKGGDAQGDEEPETTPATERAEEVAASFLQTPDW